MSKGVEYPTGKRAEILALRALGKKVREIVEATGVAQPTIYQWRDRDPLFREAWDKTIEVYREYRKELASERSEWIRDKLYEIAYDDDDPRQMDALKELRKAIDEQVQRFDVNVQASGEVRFIIESAFPEIVADEADISEDDAQPESRPALPGEPETS